jgi:hypothetical protein
MEMRQWPVFPPISTSSSSLNVSPNPTPTCNSGTIAQGDQWLQNNLGAYAQWAVNNDSLLVVVWDESDSSSSDTTNQVAAILYGSIRRKCRGRKL